MCKGSKETSFLKLYWYHLFTMFLGCGNTFIKYPALYFWIWRWGKGQLHITFSYHHLLSKLPCTLLAFTAHLGVLALHHYNVRQVPTSSHCTGMKAYEERISCPTPAGVQVASLHISQGIWTKQIWRTSEVVLAQRWLDTVASQPVTLQVSAVFQSLSDF